MGYTIKNSASKNTIFTAAGTAKAASSDVAKNSTLAGVLDSSIAKAVDVGLVPASNKKTTYTGHDNVSILVGITNTLNNASNTALRSPGADRNTRRSILSTTSVRTQKTATAVRNGYWNAVSGQYQTTGGEIFPSIANDFASLGVDGEANVSKALGGTHNYNYGANVATGIRYPAKTQ